MTPTKRQQQLLAKLWHFEQESHISPSVAEVKEMMGVKSNQSVIDMLKRLEKDKWLTRDARKARSLSLTVNTRQYLMRIGVAEILNYYPAVESYNTGSVVSEKADTTQAGTPKPQGNTSISLNIEKKSSDPQQLSLFNHNYGEYESGGTKNNMSYSSFNTVAIQWVYQILDATSTSVVLYAKEFIGSTFQNGLLYFIALRKFTEFSFPEIVVVVTFCLFFIKLFRVSRKGENVSSY